MQKVQVQYSDATKTEIIGVFAEEQPAESFPNQGRVNEDDPLLIAFLSPPQPAPQLAPLAFLDLFTAAEQEAVAAAAMQNVQAKLWWDRMLAASFITIDDPRTAAGLQSLVSLNLLTSARKAAIVSAMSS